MASSSTQRFVPLQECINFRDLGGYRTDDGRTVKWGKLYRSDAIHFMTAEDVGFVLNDLGVVTVLDLRNAEEVEREGRGIIGQSPLKYHNVSLFGGRSIVPPRPGEDPVARLTDNYQWMLRNTADKLAETVTTLAEPENLPAVFHCTAGKDRTGILAAILLGVLGVDEGQIMDDYSLTNQVMDRLGQRLQARPGNEHRSADSFKVQPEPVALMLTDLRHRYGDPVSYVRSHGASAVAVDRLKGSLLE